MRLSARQVLAFFASLLALAPARVVSATEPPAGQIAISVKVDPFD